MSKVSFSPTDNFNNIKDWQCFVNNLSHTKLVVLSIVVLGRSIQCNTCFMIACLVVSPVLKFSKFICEQSNFPVVVEEAVKEKPFHIRFDFAQFTEFFEKLRNKF